MHGNADSTTGGLTKDDLKYKKIYIKDEDGKKIIIKGKIVSKKKSELASKYSNLGEFLFRDKNSLNKK